MITLHNVRKQYENSDNEIALNNINISFKKGFIHGIIGSSGAGKSTLIRLINHLENCDTGNISVFEYKDLRNLNKESTRMLRKRIGMMFQSDHLLSRKTVIDNVLLPITFHRKLTDDDRKYAEALLDEVGLTIYKHRYPSQLSGGQRQRVGIARALIQKPELLLCDEPTSALDIVTTRNILKLIKDVSHTHNIDVIIVTHDMSVIKEVCDIVTVMDNGEIIEQGSVTDILFKSTKPVTKAFTKDFSFDIGKIKQLYENEKLLLLRFKKDIVDNSIISNMSIDIRCNVSIVYASIQPNDIGVMVLYVPDLKQDVTNYLRERFVEVEDVI